MAKIGWRYKTPIPMIFWKDGTLVPSQAIYLKRLAYLTWVFGVKCHFDCIAFSYTRKEASEGSGLSVDEIRTQEEYFIQKGDLKFYPNESRNRPNDYEWVKEKIEEERISKIEKIPNQNLEKSQFILRDELDKKSQTEIIKNPKPNEKIPNQIPTEIPIQIRVETEKNPKPNPNQNPNVYINDKTAVNLSLDNSDNVAKPRARENLSLSCKGKITAFFNRSNYRLRDGKPLSPRMQNALAKYSPTEMERVRENVKFYEEFVDNGGIITTTHEQYLQGCINKDLAKKKENKGRNLLLAKFVKEEYKMNEMEISKTAVTIRKNSYETPDPISLELSPQSFEDAIDNYINAYYPGNNNATRSK